MSQASVFTFEEVSISVLHAKGGRYQRTPYHSSPVQEAVPVPVLPWMNLHFGMETPEQGQVGKLTGCSTSLCRGSSSFLKTVQSCLLVVIPQLMNLAQ